MANLFDDEKNNTVDIPDFVEEKGDTTSTSVDMSIFKMSDDELYDDTDKNEKLEDDEDDEEVVVQKPRRKKSGANIVLLILLLLISIGLVVSLFFMFKLKDSLNTAETQISALNTKVNDLTTLNTSKDQQIADLTVKLEEALKPKAKLTYKVKVDELTFRVGPNVNEEKTTYNGDSYAYTGDTYELIEVVENGSYKWAKVDDKVYFCISNGDEVFAEPVE